MAPATLLTFFVHFFERGSNFLARDDPCAMESLQAALPWTRKVVERKIWVAVVFFSSKIAARALWAMKEKGCLHQGAPYLLPTLGNSAKESYRCRLQCRGCNYLSICADWSISQQFKTIQGRGRRLSGKCTGTTSAVSLPPLVLRDIRGFCGLRDTLAKLSQPPCRI